MPEDEGKAIGNLANLFCGLHALIQIAEAAEKSISETEKVIANVSEDVCRWTNEPMTVSLIRTCRKAFAMGADEKNSVYSHFIVFDISLPGFLHHGIPSIGGAVLLVPPATRISY